MSPQGFNKLEDLVTFYSQGNQGLPCELKHPAVPEDKDVMDDDTGNTLMSLPFSIDILCSLLYKITTKKCPMESLSWSDSFTSHIICFKHSSHENSRKIESSDNLDAR